MFIFLRHYKKENIRNEKLQLRIIIMYGCSFSLILFIQLFMLVTTSMDKVSFFFELLE